MARGIRQSIFFIFVFMFLLANAVEAAPEPVQKTATQQTAPSSTQVDTSEVKLLQRQLEDNRRFQDQMLTTVYWSLSTLAGVAVVLVGFGWFVNFRVYERDKASLERDLHLQMNEDAGALRTTINETTVANVKKLEQYLTDQVTSAETRINATTLEVVNRLEEKLTVLISNDAFALKSLKRVVLRLQLDGYLRKRISWIEKNIPRNALQASTSALEVSNEIAYENDVAEMLDYVSKDISAILAAKSTPIDNYLVAQVIAALDAVQGAHAHAAAALKAKASGLLTA